MQPIPERLAHKVQPIAVSDVLRAMVEAFPVTGQGQGLARESGAVDIGGPDVLPYSELLTDFAEAAGLRRAQVPTPPVPAPLVSLGAAAMSTAPFWTVNALVESLRHDMVCRPDHTWVPADGLPLMGVTRGDEPRPRPGGAAPPRQDCPATPTGPGCALPCSTSCTRRPRCVPAPAWLWQPPAVACDAPGPDLT